MPEISCASLGCLLDCVELRSAFRVILQLVFKYRYVKGIWCSKNYVYFVCEKLKNKLRICNSLKYTSLKYISLLDTILFLFPVNIVVQFCTNCSTELDINLHKFCHGCGKNVKEIVGTGAKEQGNYASMRSLISCNYAIDT